MMYAYAMHHLKLNEVQMIVVSSFLFLFLRKKYNKLAYSCELLLLVVSCKEYHTPQL